VREKEESLYIVSLSVAPEYRGVGLARLVLDFAEKLVKRLGKKWRARARAFGAENEQLCKKTGSKDWLQPF
jgi:GNAT superfamily N-acetyltransferase